MGSNNKDGSAALVRAVRMLGRGGIETVPEKLEELWHMMLLLPAGDAFHATEEVLVRWLLKSMAGNTDDAERVRRHTLAWRILTVAFSRIPLFSLAKSLADRRFVALLRRTLKEISVPQPEASVENNSNHAQSPNSRKRKRTESGEAHIETQRLEDGCIGTAEVVFEAIGTLLSRCEGPASEDSRNDRTGSDHIKSLLSLPASEAVQTVAPLLSICETAVGRLDDQTFRGQSTWISIFTMLWNLRQQGPSDGLEVSKHLYAPLIRLLGKLTATTPSPTLDGAVRERWTWGIERFLIRNLILPSRVEFLNEKDQGFLRLTVEASAGSSERSHPVLFELVSKSPRVLGGMASKNSFEAWMQSVFDIILATLQSCPGEQSRMAVAALVETAAARRISLSDRSLRSACKIFAQGSGVEETFLRFVSELNPETVLASDEGRGLLERVLQKARNPDLLAGKELDQTSQFVVCLAECYSKARDFTGFIKLWLENLVLDGSGKTLNALWAQDALSRRVSDLLEKSLSHDQLQEVLDWLSSQTKPADIASRIHILGAISAGIRSEEYIDAANMMIFVGAFPNTLSRKDLTTDSSAIRWEIARDAILRGTPDDVGRVWEETRHDIRHTLRKSSTHKPSTFAAFQCCSAVWLENSPGGPHEDEAAALVCSFIDRLGESKDKTSLGDSDLKNIAKETYFSWILSGSSQLLSLIAESKGGIPSVLLSAFVSAQSVNSPPRILESEGNLNNRKLLTELVDSAVSLIELKAPGQLSASANGAVIFLLDMPIEAINRPQRETAMKRLVSLFRKSRGQSIGKPSPGEKQGWQSILSLMVKLMEMPTFYEDMKFGDLEDLGIFVLDTHRQRLGNEESPEALLSQREDLKLLSRLATLSLEQMASGTLGAREQSYLEDASALLRSPSEDSETILRLLLLRAYISVLQDSSAQKQLKDWDGIASDLRSAIASQARRALKSGWRGRGLLALLAALEALDLLDAKRIKKALKERIPLLVEANSQRLDGGVEAFRWEIRMFLAKHFPEVLGSPLDIVLPDSDHSSGDKSSFLRYVDAVVQYADDETRLAYLRDLLVDQDKSDSLASLRRYTVVCWLLRPTKGTRSTTTDQFDLAQAHGILCDRLLRTTTARESILVAKALHLLLDQKASCMTQWNIELTFSTICIIASDAAASAAAQQERLAHSPKTYQWLCHLVATIIKRHRIRLGGHFHALITTLHSLLRWLLCQPPSPEGEERGANAKLFARLLTLVCEPTDASVPRSQATSLSSERDRAKRYAGQYMHLVLTQYIELQLHHTVSHEVREALDAGMYSVLDITPRDTLDVMNDALDRSGRVLFGELYKQYQRFGKWSGI